MPPVLPADWTGRRVVARVTAVGGPQPGYRDVLGDLVACDDDEVRIETRTGVVSVPRADVVSARIVYPAAGAVLALAATAARGWRAQEVQTSADGWLLRADCGWTRRANSALALRSVHRPLDLVLADVTAWYAARELPARIQVPQPAADALAHALDRRGWTEAGHADVLVSRLDLLAARTSDRPGPDVTVTFRATADDDWLGAYRGRGPLPDGAAALLARHDRVVFARVELDGALAAVGRGTVDDGWLAVTAIDVAMSHRRRGLAGAVVGALGRWGGSVGAVRAYVQTERANEGAHRLFDRLGFYHHHSYHYRSAPTID